TSCNAMKLLRVRLPSGYAQNHRHNSEPNRGRSYEAEKKKSRWN
ncbi:MAG: hypothetical protein ACI9WR_000888, partial [Paracoccaceae bacterium]